MALTDGHGMGPIKAGMALGAAPNTTYSIECFA